MHFVNAMLFALLAIFPILNPPAMTPVFMRLTGRASSRQRHRLAALIALYSFALLTGVLFVGGWLLRIMGISVPVVGIAGGLLLFHTAWRMLNDDEGVGESRARELGTDVMEKAFFPLTMPVTAGPGSMAITLTLVPPGDIANWRTLSAHLAVTCGILIASVSVFLCYRYSEPLLKRLGKTGNATLSQISAFILLAIGVQIIWNGVRALVQTL